MRPKGSVVGAFEKTILDQVLRAKIGVRPTVLMKPTLSLMFTN